MDKKIVWHLSKLVKTKLKVLKNYKCWSKSYDLNLKLKYLRSNDKVMVHNDSKLYEHLYTAYPKVATLLEISSPSDGYNLSIQSLVMNY